MQFKPFGEQEILENTLYQMTFFSNLQALLRHEDRNSMAFSVEARVPFLDHRLVEFIFSLPSQFKIRDGYTKRVLRDGMHGVVPEKIRWRVRKLGFATPERTWQKTALKPLIEAAIRDERLRPYVLAENASDYFAQLQQQIVKQFAVGHHNLLRSVDPHRRTPISGTYACRRGLKAPTENGNGT